MPLTPQPIRNLTCADPLVKRSLVGALVKRAIDVAVRRQKENKSRSATSMPEVSEKIAIAVTVNGKACKANVEPRMLLVEFLREELDLTGTHVGCDTTYCGACTVL